MSQSTLFISHDDSFTGAPTALLGILKILTEDNRYNKPDVYILRNENQLKSAYESHASSVFTAPVHKTLFSRIRNRIMKADIGRNKILKQIRSYDVVIFNTVVSLNYFSLAELRSFRATVLCIYEMPVAVGILLRDSINKLTTLKLIFSPTLILTKLLQTSFRLNVPIALLNQYIDPEYILSLSPDQEGSVYTDNAFIIGMIGTPIWPKAFEYFLCIAKYFTETYPEAHIQFVWKGVQPGTDAYAIYESDIQKAGLSDKVMLERKTATVATFYERLHVLALSSREDTYPNIMIEAALFSKPAICFKDSGGAELFVGSYGGFIIPFLSIRKYADAIFAYYSDRELLRKHGEAAKVFSLQNHCNKALILAQFREGIARVQPGI